MVRPDASTADVLRPKADGCLAVTITGLSLSSYTRNRLPTRHEMGGHSLNL